MKSLELQNLPRAIKPYIDNADKIYAINEGKSGAWVYKLSYNKYSSEESIYLKFDRKSRLYDRLSDEANVLRWLQGKLKVPEILMYDELDGMEFLITKEIEGTLLSNLIKETQVSEIVKLYAEIANEIHSINICNCPFSQTIYDKMKQAKARIYHQEISSSTFDVINKAYTPKELFKYLEYSAPLCQHLVFTHGDLYMNNILVKNLQLAGVVDLARGGCCDYHYDISIILHNIDKYLGIEYQELFLRYYKFSVNQDLIDYYWKLNEFF